MIAGCYDSYFAFADLFDKIIEEYHLYDIKNSTHPRDLDYEKLKDMVFDSEEA